MTHTPNQDSDMVRVLLRMQEIDVPDEAIEKVVANFSLLVSHYVGFRDLVPESRDEQAQVFRP